MRDSVKIISAALDEVEGGEIILRGVIEPGSLSLLQVGEYQREILPMSKISDLIKGMETGSVPDIDLGMRGGNYSERDGAFYLKDPIYIVDGLQRRTAALAMMQGGGSPRLGVVVHFNTNEVWERERFRMLNVSRVKLSANILLRNMRSEHPSVDLLFGLTHDKTFVLGNRVCWSQNMRREQLLTSVTFIKVVGQLHGRFKGTKSNRMEDLVPGMDKVMGLITRKCVRENTLAFFDLVDECWGLKSIVYKEGAIYLRDTFLQQLARVLSDHTTFWDDNKLVVSRELRKKIAQFPTNDPTVMNLAGASGKARTMLYQLIVDHINSGKRQHRLVRFGGVAGSNASGD